MLLIIVWVHCGCYKKLGNLIHRNVFFHSSGGENLKSKHLQGWSISCLFSGFERSVAAVSSWCLLACSHITIISAFLFILTSPICLLPHSLALIRSLANGFKAHHNLGWSHLKILSYICKTFTNKVIFIGTRWTYLWENTSQSTTVILTFSIFVLSPSEFNAQTFLYSLSLDLSRRL